jgi:hypothetical protein
MILKINEFVKNTEKYFKGAIRLLFFEHTIKFPHLSYAIDESYI